MNHKTIKEAWAFAVTFLLLSTGINLTFSAIFPSVSADTPFSVNLMVNNETIVAEQYHPAMAVGAAGDIYLVWEDYRNIDPDIYFTNSSDKGETWRDPDIKINNDSVNSVQSNPAIATYSSETIYVVWEDYRNSNSDIYFANSTNGGANWSDPNIKINTDILGVSQRYPDIAVDSSGTIYAVWEDVRNGDWDIYFAKSSNQGVNWTHPNVRVGNDTTNSSQRFPSIIVDPIGNVYVAWQDDRTGDRDIFLSKSMDGGMTWLTNDIRINSDTLNESQRYPKLASDLLGNVFVAWEDKRNGDWDIYLANSTDSGATWSNPNLRVNTDSGSSDQTALSIAVDTDNIIHMAWQDLRKGDPDIYYSNSTDGGATWAHPNLRVNDDKNFESQQNPTIATYSSDRIFVAWEDRRSLTTYDIYFATIVPLPTLDYIILTDSPGGTPLEAVILPVGGNITIYASGFNLTSGVFVDLVEVNWIQNPPLGSLTNLFGNSTTFIAGFTTGLVDINGTSGINPLWTDNFSLNILPPTADYIQITDVPNGQPIIGDIVPLDFKEWGNCSAYNLTVGYIGTVNADWSVDGGDATLLGPEPEILNGIDVGTTTGRVWLNASYNGHTYSIQYSVSPWAVDYIQITDVPDGNILTGGNVSVGFLEWGNCSAYNITGGFIDVAWADWTVKGGDSILIAPTPGFFCGLNVSFIPDVVWLNASYKGYVFGVQYNVTPPKVDYIMITDGPGGPPLSGGIVPVKYQKSGSCSAYNKTVGFIDVVSANWTAEGGNSSLLGISPAMMNGIDVGINGSIVWLNASYNNTHNFSIQYNVIPPSVDYIEITDLPGGSPLTGSTVPVGFTEWGYCCMFNDTIGYIGRVSANWTADGGTSSLLGGTPSDVNGINVSKDPGEVWLNTSVSGFNDSVLYIVLTPVVDYIEITDNPGGTPLVAKNVSVGFLEWGACSLYNNTGGYIRTGSGDWKAEGGTSSLFGPTPEITNAIQVGIVGGDVWFNVSYNGHSDSVLYNVSPPTVDYIEITDIPDGTQLVGSLVSFGFQEWGNCSGYNDTADFIGVLDATWTAKGGNSLLLGATPAVLNGIDVGTIEGPVWFNASWGGYNDSVQYEVIFATIDYIQITDVPNGTPLLGGSVPLGHREWGNCSAYNITHGYVGHVTASWTVEGGGSSLLNVTPSSSNGVDVGLILESVWLNASYTTFTYSIRYDIIPPTPDVIEITDIPNGNPVLGGTVLVGERIWGHCSAFNDTVGYIGVVNAQWTAEGGTSSLLDSTPGTFNGIDVGIIQGIVWFNASYGGRSYSIQFTVSPPLVDYIEITDVPNGTPLPGGIMPLGIREWGNCSSYNNTAGFIGTVNADWTAEGQASTLLGISPAHLNGIDLGTTDGTVWFNASFDGATDSVQYLVSPPTVDFIKITDVPGGAALEGGVVPVGFREWGNCSAYNDSVGFIDSVAATWSTFGGTSTVFIGAPTVLNGINVGKIPGIVWLLANFEEKTFGVQYTVSQPTVDKIIIRSEPDDSGKPVGDRTYIVYQQESFYAAAYNNTAGYISDVDATWESSDENVGIMDISTIQPKFIAQLVQRDLICIVNASYLGIKNSTGYLTVLKPMIDEIIIRDAEKGEGNITTSRWYSAGETDQFYAAAYNDTAKFLYDVEVFWSSDDVTVGLVTSFGIWTNFTAQELSEDGICKITAFYSAQLSDSTGIITVLAPIDDPPPDAPIQPTLKVLGKDKIEITWTPNTESDMDHYIIQRATSPDGPWINVTNASRDETSFTDSGLEPGASYYYRIIAVDEAGNESPHSQEAHGTTETGSSPEEESPWVLLLVIPIIIIVLLLILFLIRRKPKEKELTYEEKALRIALQEQRLSNNRIPPPPRKKKAILRVTKDKAEPSKGSEKEEEAPFKAEEEEEEEPPPPDDEDEEPPPPDDEDEEPPPPDDEDF
ncbi:MAG: fibronectin type III domain-containing protein [Thermoplasmata archaeon]|nr:MAG: fibronectin type III domain-containing protein [Thermoplasmata archaeon]